MIRQETGPLKYLPLNDIGSVNLNLPRNSKSNLHLRILCEEIFASIIDRLAFYIFNLICHEIHKLYLEKTFFESCKTEFDWKLPLESFMIVRRYRFSRSLRLVMKDGEHLP